MTLPNRVLTGRLLAGVCEGMNGAAAPAVIPCCVSTTPLSTGTTSVHPYIHTPHHPPHLPPRTPSCSMHQSQCNQQCHLRSTEQSTTQSSVSCSFKLTCSLAHCRQLHSLACPHVHPPNPLPPTPSLYTPTPAHSLCHPNTLATH